MKRQHKFASVHALPFVIVATLAWMVGAGIASYMASGRLRSSLADGMAQSLGNLAEDPH